eukprot:TRINITY_DN2685_c0_g1_i9.p2 TRINITY_DN2685_c0_g1~~TRINITY_DN2685_c0_g1_i9.p2  ORF type:complete len:385 (-),score=52.20 TRINITY_DN2685_c0_g1_i9:3104-4258(-)
MLAVQEKLSWQNGQYQEESIELQKAQNIPLDPLTEKDDVDAYITQFERIATMSKWKETTWASRMVSLLRGRPRDAVMRLKADQMNDYATVVTTLLDYFRLDAEAYRKRFRAMKKEPEETFKQVLGRLRTCLTRWCVAAGCDEDNAEEVKDLFLQEQIYNQFSPDFVFEVRRAGPKTAEEVATEATKLANVRQAGREAEIERRRQRGSQPAMQGNPSLGVGRFENRPSTSQSKQTMMVRNTKGEESRNRGSIGPGQVVRCLHCNQTGHVARYCPKVNKVGLVRATGIEEVGMTPQLCGPCALKPYNPRVEVIVNGTRVTGLRDTGASQIVVAKKLVPVCAYTGKTTNIMLADAERKHDIPCAIIELKTFTFHQWSGGSAGVGRTN